MALLNRDCGRFAVRRGNCNGNFKRKFCLLDGLPCESPQLCVVPAPCLSLGAGQRPQLQVYSQGDMAKAFVQLCQVLVTTELLKEHSSNGDLIFEPSEFFIYLLKKLTVSDTSLLLRFLKSAFHFGWLVA